ncbi:unnamed protein product [Camellia sinensis]
MELEDVESDLQALRKLYGLLQSNGNGSRSESLEYLDEKARVFLKNLLDGATERVFEAHSKFMEAQLGLYNLLPDIQFEKLKGMPMLRPPVSPDVSIISHGVGQSSAKAPNCNPITTREDKQTIITPPTQASVSEWSKFSSSAMEPQNRKRRCRACQQRSIKQVKSTEEHSHEITWNPKKDIASLQHRQPNQSSRFYWDTGLVKLDKQSIGSQQKKTIHKIEPNLSGAGSLTCSPIISGSGVAKSVAIYDTSQEIGKSGETGFISKEVADAIRQVELRISSLQLAAELVCPSETMANSILGIDSVSPIKQTKQGVVTWSELSQDRKFVIGRDDSLSKQLSQRVRNSKKLSRLPQVVSQSHKPYLVGNDLLSQMARQNTVKPRETELPDQVARQSSKLLLPYNGPVSRLVSEKVGQSTNTALPNNDLSGHVGKPLSKGHGKPNWRTIQVTDQDEPMNRLQRQKNGHTSSSHARNCVRGLRVPPSPTNMANVSRSAFSSNKMPCQIEKENRNQNLMSQDLIRKGRTSQLSKPHQMITKPTPRDQKISQRMVSPTLYGKLMDQERGGVQEWVAQRKKILPRKQESEDTSSSSRSYSSWTSQQASSSGSDSKEYSLLSHKRGHRDMVPSSCSDSEEYSLPSHTRGQHDMSPTSSSDSEGYLLSGRTEGRYVGPTTSRSESEVNSLPSRGRPHHVGPTSSSESEECPPSDRVRGHHHMALSSRSTSMDSTKGSRLGDRVKPKKPIGGLRRLKDKLALIFHHHHHHHHHHHNDHRYQKAKVGHGGTSLWKNAGKKIFDSANKGEAYGEKAAEKLTKSVVCKVPDKKQHGHFFHTLVKGLLNSKKSKVPKGSIKRLGSGRHGSKKAVKKLQWWHMFRHQRAVKMPSKTKARVKLGVGSKKRPGLQALPKMR